MMLLANGIMSRAGTGRVKHLSTKQLWVQSVLEKLPITVQNIYRWHNCRDELTHSVSGRENRRQLETVRYHIEDMHRA